MKIWRNWVVILALAAYVMLLWWWASFGYPTEATICSPPGSTNNCESHNILFALTVLALDKLNFYGVVITAIATGFIAYFTLTLKRSTDNLWRATIKAEKRSEEDTRILQRAYVAVEPSGIHELLEGDKLIGHVKIINAGNLPAKNLGWFIDLKFSSNGLETNFPLGTPRGNIIIVPRANSVRGSGKNIEVGAIGEAAGGDGDDRATESNQYIYVWGIVQYSDGFGVIRTTEFCHRYNWKMRGKGGVGYNDISTEYARQHDHGNDAT